MQWLHKLKKYYMFIFCVFPMACACVLSLRAVLSKEEKYLTGHYIWNPLSNRGMSFLVIFLFFFVLCILIKTKNKKMLILFAAVGCFLRMGIYVLFASCSVPYSDSLQVWNIANGNNESLLYKSFFPEWSNWAALQKVLVNKFSLSYADFVLGQFICGFVIAFLIYLLTVRMTKDNTTAWFACVIYLWMPSQILYNFYVSPDIFALMIFMVAIYILISGLERYKNYKIFFAEWLGMGFLLGLASCYKPLGMIVVIAAVIVLLWFWCAKKESHFLLKLIICLCSICLLMSGISKAMHELTEKILGTEVSESATISYMCIGLNTEGEGQIHLGKISRTYNNLRLAGASEDDATDETKRILLEDWEKNYSKIPQLFVDKMIWAWQDDLVPHLFFVKNVISQEQMKKSAQSVFGLIEQYGAGLCQWYYVAIMLFGLAGAIAGMRYLKDNHAFFLYSLFIFGFALVLLLSEAQSRYKANTIPLLMVLSAYGYVLIVKGRENKNEL